MPSRGKERGAEEREHGCLTGPGRAGRAAVSAVSQDVHWFMLPLPAAPPPPALRPLPCSEETGDGDTSCSGFPWAKTLAEKDWDFGFWRPSKARGGPMAPGDWSTEERGAMSACA
jgi:hypothetical protein